jgi:hypothetical protein
VAKLPTDHLKFCPERGLLLDALSRATSDYGRAAVDLATSMGMLPELEYVRLKGVVEAARVDAEHCRNALLKHREQHGC